MTVPLITTKQITLGITVSYFAIIFAILLGVDRFLKNYQFFRNSFASRVVVALILYIPLSGILSYFVQPVMLWLHDVLNVPFP